MTAGVIDRSAGHHGRAVMACAMAALIHLPLARPAVME
jgi:hypothetical protein